MGVEQRELIKTRRSDFPLRRELLIRLEVKVAKRRIAIDYIPDRFLFIRSSLAAWLQAYQDWSGSDEWLALNILDDINNEVVPLWVRVTCWVSSSEKIVLEDKQPNWQLSTLVQRLIIN